MKRRNFLLYVAGSSLGIYGGRYLYRTSIKPGPIDAPASIAAMPDPIRHRLLVPGSSGPLGNLHMSDAPLTLNARSTTLPFIQNKQSPFLIYDAQYGGNAYQNPIIHIKRGNQFNARLQNDLDDPTIIHWHGLHLPGIMDGHPRTTIAAGGHYDYAFPVTNRSGMYWYHTHAHNLTAKQAYFGLAGIFMVEDEDETALRNTLHLEQGITELPLLIQDKQFNSAGQISYPTDPKQQMMGQLGDTILVNLTPQPQLEIARRLYRFRVLNGSNARIYKLAFMHRGEKLRFNIIGTDGGLLERPYTAQEAFLAPAERVDILFDASQLRTGEEIFLKSLAFDAMENDTMSAMSGMAGSMPGKMGALRLALGAEFEIMKLAVTRDDPPTSSVLPSELSIIERIDTRSAAVRNISLTMQHMRGLINGKSFDMDSYPIQTRNNTVELWDIQNARTSMPHPMHLHGVSFQVVSRSNSPKQVGLLAQDGSGRLITDLGWKDTVLVWPGETVRIAIDFSNAFIGDQTYLFHCHNLEHEDKGMMVNCRVAAA